MSDTANIYEQVPDQDTVGGRLSRAREAAGLSLTEMAWKAGVRTATLRGWESDRSMPGSHRLATVAGLLQVSLSWIVYGVGTGPREEEEEPAPRLYGEIGTRLDRLQRLHAELGSQIGALQADLARLTAPSP